MKINEHCYKVNACPHSGPAPIPQEGIYEQVKSIEQISGFSHGCGKCAPRQGVCKLTLNVKKGIISNQVYDAYKKKMGKKSKLNQIKAWAHSLPEMVPILSDLPENVGIAIEFNIPLTSKRVDFVVSGYDINHKPVLLLFELKQHV